eukprot:9059597-Alexandrium_andersonii.AAC.1
MPTRRAHARHPCRPITAAEGVTVRSPPPQETRRSMPRPPPTQLPGATECPTPIASAKTTACSL